MQNNPFSQDITQYIKDLVRRIDNLEARNTGSMFVEGQIITVDPSTGVQTIIGDLSSEGENRFGVKEWINDVEPPPVPTSPLVVAHPGFFAVTWDGSNEGLLPHAPDFNHIKVYGTNGTSTMQVGVLKSTSEIAVFADGVAGEVWSFWLTSVDHNGNESAVSEVSPDVSVITLLEDPHITDKINDLLNGIDDVTGLVGTKGKVWMQAEAPDAGTTYAWTGVAHKSSSTKTVGGIVQKNFSQTPSAEFLNFGWNVNSGTQHSLSVDSAHFLYGTKSMKYTTKTEQQFAISAYSVGGIDGYGTSGVSANTEYSTRVSVYCDPTYPPMRARLSIAFRLASGSYTMTTYGDYVYEPSANGWYEPKATFTTPSDAIGVRLGLFFETADFSVKLPIGSEGWADASIMVEGSVLPDYFDGDTVDDRHYDLWIDSDDGNKTYRWDSATNSWVSFVDARITKAQTTADGKNKVWRVATAPSGSAHATGDTWYDTDDKNRVYVWDGTTWAPTRDLDIDKAISDALSASSIAGSARTAAAQATAQAASADAKAGSAITASQTATAQAASAVSRAGSADATAASAWTAAKSATAAAQTATAQSASASNVAASASAKADTAWANAAQATATANQAMATALSASSVAVSANNVAASARTDATTAKSVAASADAKAVSAQNAAASAQTVAGNANVAANSAIATAQAASTTAKAAESVAASANTKAAQAESVAGSASADAITAKNIAASAETKAASAITAAQSATGTASNAVVTANSALATAQAASTAAVNANTVASSANSVAASANNVAASAETKAANAVTTSNSATATAASALSKAATAEARATTASALAASAEAKAGSAQTAAQSATAVAANAVVTADQAKASALAASANAVDAYNRSTSAISTADSAISAAASAQNAADQAMTEAESKASPEYILSRGTDLITNGTGYLGDNTNFSDSTYDQSIAPEGAVGAFVGYEGYRGTINMDELVPVDTNKRYMLSYLARQMNLDAVGTTHYSFLAPQDSQGLAIQTTNYMFRGGTTTTLAQPLKVGDTKVYLTDATNWYNNGTTHLQRFIFWNYVDPSGKAWAPHTYSRNGSGSNTWDAGAVNFTDNSITLKTPWNHNEYPAGTPLSNGSAGGNYMYFAASNQPLSMEWARFSGTTIKGVLSQPNTPGDSGWAATDKFPPGTAGVRLGWLLNYTNAPPAPASKMAFAAVSLSDVSAALAEAESARIVADNAQASANAAASAAQQAASAAGAAQTTADGKNTVWWTTPPATGNKTGDLWFKTTEGNRPYQWNGAWTAMAYGASAISANQINSAHVITGAITAGKISSLAIRASNIAANQIMASALQANVITATAIASNAITATAIAADSITASHIVSNAISADEIQATAITASHIRTDAIQANHISATAVVASHIRAAAIEAGHIKTDAVTADAIAATAVTASHIRANAIETGHIKADAVTAVQIAATAVVASHIRANAVEATHIKADAINAGHIQATAIAASHIRAGAVEATHIKANAIDATHIKADAITATAIAATAIMASHLRAGAVEATHIAASAIVASHIKTDAIETRHIKTNAVTADAIAATAITAVHIAANAISANHIQATAIAASHIRASAIDATHITVDAVEAKHIKTDAVTADAIAATAVQAVHIAANAIDASKIQATAISASHIRANAIETGHIKADAVTAVQIAASAINATHINGKAITATAIAASAIDATHIAANAITATAIKADSIAASHIVSNAITADEIAATAVTASHIRALAVNATHLEANTITATALAAQSITASAIKANAITATALAAGSITATALAAQSITATALAAESITATALAAGSITATALAVGAITATAIAANTISVDKLAVGDFTNYVMDIQSSVDRAVFGETTHYKYLNTAGVAPNAGTPWFIRANPGMAPYHSMVVGKDIPVNAGDKINFSVRYKRAGADKNINLNATEYKADGTVNAYDTTGSATMVTTAVDGVWTTATGFATVREGTAYLRPNLKLAASSAFTGSYDIQGLEVRRMVSGQLIVDGSVGANQIAASSISASHIQVESLTGDRLVANAITAEKIASNTITVDNLLVMSMDNLIENPSFDSTIYTTSWALTSVSVTSATASTHGGTGKSIYHTSSNTALDIASYAKSVIVDVGEAYNVAAWFFVEAGTTAGTFEVRFKNQGTTPIANSTTNVPYTTALNKWHRISKTIEIPAGVTGIKPSIVVRNITTGKRIWVDDISVTRAANSNLIVDGAIDGRTITGALVQSESAANRGVKLTSTGIKAYNTVGAQTVVINSDGSAEFTGKITMTDGTVPAANLSGTVSNTQIAGVDGSKVTGTLAATVPTTKLTGTVTDSQIAGVAGTKVSGTVANATNATNATTATSATTAGSATNATNVTGTVGSAVRLPVEQIKEGVLPADGAIKTGTGTSRVELSNTGLKAFQNGTQTVGINSDGTAFFKGSIEVGSNVPESVIPTLPQSKITNLSTSLDSASATAVTTANAESQRLWATAVRTFQWAGDRLDTVTVSNATTTIVHVPDAPSSSSVLRKTITSGGNIFWDKNPIPFDPEALYRITFKVRVVTDATNIPNTNNIYAGIHAWDASSSGGPGQRITTTGVYSTSSSHYFAAAPESINASEGWKTFTGYFQGWGTGDAGNGGERMDVSNPGKVHPKTRYISPMTFLDYPSGNGVWDIGMVALDVLSTEAQGRINQWTFTGTTEINGGAIKADSITATQIAANAITANKIDSSQVWADTAFLGAVESSQMKLKSSLGEYTTIVDSKGVLVNRDVVQADGSPATFPAVQLGAFGDNRFATYGPEGQVLGSFDIDGGLVASSATIDTDPSVGGRSVFGALSEFQHPGEEDNLDGSWLGAAPRGMVAYGYRDMTGFNSLYNEVGFMELSFEVYPYRAYMVVIEPFHLWLRNEIGTAKLSVRTTFDGTTPTLATATEKFKAGGNSNVSNQVVDVGSWSFLVGTGSGSRYTRKMLFTMSGSSSFSVVGSADYGLCRVQVYDMGADVPHTEVARAAYGTKFSDGTTSAPDTSPAKKSYYATWFGDWMMSYYNNGSSKQVTGQGASMLKQGQDPYWSGGGRQTSQFGITSGANGGSTGETGKSIASALSGSTLTKAVLKIWGAYDPTGSSGVVRVHWHGNSGAPSSYVDGTSIANFIGDYTIKNGGSVDIVLPSAVRSAIKAGTCKGFSFAPRGSTSSSYILGVSWSTKPRLTLYYDR